MSRKAWLILSFLGFVAAQVEVADALPRHRRSNTYYYYGNNAAQYVSPTSTDGWSDYPTLDAQYNYDEAMKPDVAFSDQIQVALKIADPQVLNSREPIVAEVKITDLSASDTTIVKYLPVSIDRKAKGEYKPATVDVVNACDCENVIQPAKVYRLHVSLHRQSRRYSNRTALGQVHLPYFVATSGKQRMNRARQQIAMRTFKELYYAKQGWASDENYVMDCYAYYMWATGFCTVGAQYGTTNLGVLFNGETPFGHGGEIPEVAEKSPIHGDYIRMPGHSFMLLAYDKDTEQVWTMEGNYGATIEIARRSVSTGWSFGHLVDKHIRREMFKVDQTASTDDNSFWGLD